MPRAMSLAIASIALGATFTPSYGQSLTDRVDGVRDGVVRLSFETRAVVCGDGQSIGEQTAEGLVTHTFWSEGYSIQNYEFWQPDCRNGPMRLVIEKQSGVVSELRAAVGVDWMADARGTDLGSVAGPEVADWLAGPFYKTVCRVGEGEFEKARECPDHVIMTESALEGREVATDVSDPALVVHAQQPQPGRAKGADVLFDLSRHLLAHESVGISHRGNS